MTDQEYNQLVTTSAIYKNLKPEAQQKILGSTGEKRERYVSIFTELKNGNISAVKKFLEKNNEIVKKFKDSLKTDEKAFLRKGEEKSKNRDEGEAEKLLTMLNNL
jgi:hypothetical protein